MYRNLILLLAILCTEPFILFAQEPTPEQRPDLYVDIQDSTLVYRVVGPNDTIPANQFWAAYGFEMAYDSTCRTNIILTEFKKNQQRLKLLQWQDNKLITATDSTLSDSSRTQNFALSTGDTISFYRELQWYNPITRRMDTNNYYALDTLDYSIELVRASNGTRLALLDSLGVLRRNTPGRPVIYGLYPIMAKVNYVTPLSFNGITAFMRINLYSRGNGPHGHMRLDQIVMGLSNRLTASEFASYRSIFNISYTKRNIRDLEEAASASQQDKLIDMSLVSKGSRSIRISFHSANSTDINSIVIYDNIGQLIFTAAMSNDAVNTRYIEHTFERSGLYFIGALRHGELIAVKKAIIP